MAFGMGFGGMNASAWSGVELHTLCCSKGGIVFMALFLLHFFTSSDGLQSQTIDTDIVAFLLLLFSFYYKGLIKQYYDDDTCSCEWVGKFI